MVTNLMENKNMNTEKIAFNVKGTVTLKVTRKDGSILTKTISNLITLWGLSSMAGALAGVAINPPIQYLALGSGSTAPTEADTALEAQVGAREQVTVTHLTGDDSYKVEFNKAWAEGAITGTFREAGMFDAVSLGNMFNRLVFAETTVAATDTFEVTWLVEFQNV